MLANATARVYNTRMNTKILILSDSHGRIGKLKNIIISNLSDVIIYLGDGEKDLEAVLTDLHIDLRTNLDGGIDEQIERVIHDSFRGIFDRNASVIAFSGFDIMKDIGDG